MLPFQTQLSSGDFMTQSCSSATIAPDHRPWAGKRILLVILLLLSGSSLVLYYANHEPLIVTSAATDTLPVLTIPNTVSATPAVVSQSKLVIGNPEVTMDVEHGLLRAKLALIIHLPELTSPVTGSVAISGTPQLSATGKQFFLTAPIIDQVDLPELPVAARARVDKALTIGVETFFRERAAYAPQEQSGLQTGSLKMVL